MIFGGKWKRCALVALVFASVGLCNRGEYLNSTGKDGRFHLPVKPRAYLCLNIAFDTGVDLRNESNLKGQLVFEGTEGAAEDLASVGACTPVTQKMIDRVNEVLDLVIKQYGPRYNP